MNERDQDDLRFMNKRDQDDLRYMNKRDQDDLRFSLQMERVQQASITRSSPFLS